VNNVPETARICRITHAPDARHPVLEQGGVTHAGAPAIRAHLEALNEQVGGPRLCASRRSRAMCRPGERDRAEARPAGRLCRLAMPHPTPQPLAAHD